VAKLAVAQGLSIVCATHADTASPISNGAGTHSRTVHGSAHASVSHPCVGTVLLQTYIALMSSWHEIGVKLLYKRRNDSP
jgi:hypothetical protein